MNIPLLITRDDASELLSMGKRKVWEITDSGALPHKRIGRSVRYDPLELKAWVTLGCPTDSEASERVRAWMRTAR